MEYTYLILLCILFIPILLLFILRPANKKTKQEESVSIPTPVEPVSMQIDAEAMVDEHIEPGMDYSKSYQAKYLLTKNEWHEYRKLKQYAQNLGLQVCPKVRLLDIIEPRKGTQNYKSLFYKIQAKHVDFVLCDQNLYIKAIVELDDNSHNQTDRQERDRFVDQILTSVGYQVIRTRFVTEETLLCLNTALPPKN